MLLVFQHEDSWHAERCRVPEWVGTWAPESDSIPARMASASYSASPSLTFPIGKRDDSNSLIGLLQFLSEVISMQCSEHRPAPGGSWSVDVNFCFYLCLQDSGGLPRRGTIPYPLLSPTKGVGLHRCVYPRIVILFHVHGTLTNT